MAKLLDIVKPGVVTGEDVQKIFAYAKAFYDRYHMQAQFGRDVMGAVRLEEAQKHRQEAEALNKIDIFATESPKRVFKLY